MDLIENLRLALLISLILLLVAILWRRFKRKVIAEDLPAPQHAELTDLQVAYHPPRLRVEVTMPSRQELQPSLVDRDHDALHHWSKLTLANGSHVFELDLPGLPDGEHYFQLASSTQRTVRVFRLQQT